MLKAGYRRARIAPRRIDGERFGNNLRTRPDAQPARLPANPLADYFESHADGPGILKPLNYFEVYHRHLAKFIGRPVSLVEIGVYSGGSLGMWRHYLGPGCHVNGIDIEPECRRHQDDNVDIFIGDQADPAFWSDFRRKVPVVDIVIDDGGHHTHQQIPTLEALLPHIQDGGVYICEDVGGVHNGFQAYVEGLSRNIHATGHHTTGFQQTVKSLHLYPFMVVIEKPEVPASQFGASTGGTEWASFAHGPTTRAARDGAAADGDATEAITT